MNFKQLGIYCVLAVSSVALLTGCGGGGGSKKSDAGKTFKPTQKIEWTVTSSPGGGSDIYTRLISDVATQKKFVDQPFVIANKTDGGGEIGRAAVAGVKKGKQADHSLLTFNSGDLMPMVKNTPNRLENFQPICIMAVDKQLLFKTPDSKFADFKAVLAALKSGQKVTIGGSKGDDMATYEKLIKEIKVTKEQCPFVTFNSTGEAITAALGGHVDILLSKPAAASEYVEAKRLVPILALSTERYTGNLASAPKLSEVDKAYKDVEVPVWRGLAGPKDMSPEAVAFWSDVMKKVSETEEWKNNYIKKNMLIPNYMDHNAAAKFMKDFQTEYMATNGIK